MAGTWDSARVKVSSSAFLMLLASDPLQAQLRLTAQRLGQLQDKKDASAQIARREIAGLLKERNVPQARLKAQKLMQEDAASDVLEILEMHCGVILEHFGDLERRFALPSLPTL